MARAREKLTNDDVLVLREEMIPEYRYRKESRTRWRTRFATWAQWTTILTMAVEVLLHIGQALAVKLMTFMGGGGPQ